MYDPAGFGKRWLEAWQAGIDEGLLNDWYGSEWNEHKEIAALPGVTSVGLVNRLPILHRGGNSQRYHEIGVRMVLGANAFNVANHVLSRGMALVAVGLVIGLTASYWTTAIVQRLLFGIGSTDPITFIVTALGFGSVALLACLVPAWRATRTDPVRTLQAE